MRLDIADIPHVILSPTVWMRTSLDWLHEQEHAGVALSLLVSLAVSALSVTGALRFPDGVAYDVFVAVAPAWEETTPQVLLLEAGREEITAGDPVWLRLVSELRRQGARQIVFGFVPEHGSPDFFEAAGVGDVVLGRSLAGALAGAETPRLLTLPAAAAGKTFPTAVAAFAPPQSGVYRYQLVKVALEGGDMPALEVMAAQRRHPSGWRAPERPYLVNFNDGVDRLPIMHVRQALEGELVPELVAGRSVLVAPGRESYPVGLDTPGAGDERPLSPIEFHGYALETLLAGRTIATVPPSGLPLVLALVALVNFWLYKRAGLRFAGAVTAALLAVYALSAYAALGLARVWVPFVEAVLVLAAQGIALVRRGAGAETRALVAILGELTARVREWVFPASVHDSPEFWAHLGALVHQTLDLERVIFFECVRRRWAREVHSLGCALTDITERRRDYGRTPYTTAIAEQGPIRVDDFLTPGAIREEQFLAPWLYGGEVVGFWAIGVDPDRKARVGDFDALLRDFSNEIAALVFEHLESRRPRDTRLRRTLRWLHPEGRRRYGAVAAAATRIERRLSALEQVLNHLSTAAVFYDLFGRVILVNRPMMDLTGSVGIPIYDLTALDLVMTLTGKDIGEARRALRRVIVERVVISLPAALPGGRHDHVLGLAPIDRETGLGLPRGERTPFELDGVLCELLTVSALRKAYANKERMMAQFALRLRNDFRSIITCLGVLEGEDTETEARRGAIEAIRTHAEDATRVIDEAERLLAADLVHEAADAYPVDLKAAVEAAVRELKPLAESRQVLLETGGTPDFIRLAIAEPGDLMTVIRSIYLPVIQDSIEQGRVEVRLSDSNSWITLELNNAGFGIPNDRLQEYLHGNEALRSEEFRRLRQAARRVSEWGGALEGESQVGVGMRFTLRLRPYL